MSYEYPAEVVQDRAARDTETRILMREMAALLNVVSLEWPRQIKGTEWEKNCKEVLARYRKWQKQ